MNRYITVKIILFALILFFLTGEKAYSQNNQSVIQWFKDQYQYINTDLEVSQDSLTKMAELWRNSADKTKSEKSRQEALKNLIQTMVHVQGVEQQYTPAAISALVTRFRSLEGLSLPPDNQIHNGVATVNYEDVQSVGNGDTDIILLSDIFSDVSVYSHMMKEASDDFTFHPLNLPGIGDKPALNLPKVREYENAPWFSKIEDAVVEYVRSNKISKPMIMGIWGSGYLAVRLVRNHPDLFSKVVLVNAPINILWGLAPTNPTGFSPVQTRITYLERQIPNIFPLPDSVTSQSNARGRAGFFTSKEDAEAELIKALSQPSSLVVQQYIGELFAQDYFADLADISTPLLSVNSASAVDGLTASSITPYLIGEWQKARLSHTDAPINQVVLEDTRIYLPLEAPVEIAAILRAFREGRIVDPVDGDPTLRRYQLSARNSLRGMIGATPIEIDYGSPSMRGRTNIYGNTIAYETPWRAGANHITTIKFYKGVIINKQHIPKGKYGFFVIPKETEPWEVALTKYSSWAAGGTFGYDSTYKMLSIQVEPIEDNVEEYLRYFVEQNSSLDGAIGFTWAGKRIEIEVKTPVDVQAISKTPITSVPEGNWSLLATENDPDGANLNNADAKLVEYFFDSRTGLIWFRIVLQKAVDPSNIGMNLVLDTDQNQGNGTAWWGGSNNTFMYDRLGTLFVTRTPTGDYAGTIGFSNHEHITNNGNLTHEMANNYQLAIDEEQNIWYVAVPLNYLDSDGEFDLSIAVGSSSLWNDDIPNNGSLKIYLTDNLD